MPVFETMSGPENTTRYNPATMSRIDVESRVEEMEAQIMPAEDRGKDRRRMMIGSGVVIALALIIVAIAVGASKGGGGGESSNGELQSKSAETSDGGGIVIASPPSDLSDVCSPENVATAAGYDECEKLCEKAECCTFPVSLDLSCLDGNEDSCIHYNAACHNLDLDDDGGADDGGDDGAEVPPAPSDLDAVCDPTSLATIEGFTSCENACSEAECCYVTNKSNCYFANKDACDKYSPCMTLTGTDKMHDKVQEEVERKCSEDAFKVTEGVKACRDVCQPALCCFVTDEATRKILGASAGTTSCLKDLAADWCGQYDACKKLNDVPGDATGYSLKKIVDEACMYESEEETETNHTGGITPCESLCGPGDCCFADENSGEDCRSIGIDIDCFDYSSCSVLWTDEDSDVVDSDDVTKADIDAACDNNDEEEMINVPGHLSQCDTLCEPGKCCLTDIESESCDSIGIDVDCDKYASCNTVRETNNDTVDVSKEDIDAACTVDKLRDEAEDCMELCMPGACCYADLPEDSCSSQNIAVDCADFESCGTLIKYDMGLYDDDGGKLKLVIDDACSLEAIYADEDNCMQKCIEGICCFAQLEENNCVNSNVDVDCGDYDSCGNLVAYEMDHYDEDGGEAEDEKADVDAACSPQAIVDDEQGCVDICDPAACCFAELAADKCAAIGVDIDCAIYDTCSNLILYEEDRYDEDAAEMSKSVIDEACSKETIADSGDGVCYQLCAAAVCCFPESPAQSCENLGVHVDCDDYDSCSFLFQYGPPGNEDGTEDDESGGVVSKEKEIDEACSKENIATSGDSACYELCAEGVCCFPDSPSQSCEEVGVDITCDYYDSCAFLFEYGPPGDQ